MFSYSLRQSFSNIFDNKELILALVKRDVLIRYKGSILGGLWNIINPLLMLAIYGFVFGIVFKAKWGVDTDKNFAMILFCGLMVHTFVAEVINGCPLLIQSNANYVKKVVFPLEILPIKVVMVSLFNHIISLAILIFFIVSMGFGFAISWLYYPLLLFPLICISLGIGYIVTSMGAYVKDTAYIVGFITTILLFLSPIFYPVSAIPEKYHVFIFMNPFAYLIEQAREILIYDNMPDISGLVTYSIFSILFLLISMKFFNKLKAGFSDVI
ncbi:sugar ABC transporter permease [Enterovibrio norvegicus]|uniref:ABC transporter permease n=1 Tax=Enterovibrio norvegicus TaxID=188144 RepID=UPI0003034176|nr:ABC transporter permease [Enterovibrio norvegicus]OEE68507.1 sugar ABC transporter permease [Enterovibrio norvegicus]